MSTSTPTTTTSRSVLCNVYKYIGEDLWYDQGTGFCVYKTVHEDNGDEHDEILVEDLIDQSRLLISQVSEHKDYEQLEETKILWTEDTGANILALSFLSREDCDYIWHVIGIERGKEGKEECKKSVRANMLIRERCDTATDNRPRTAVDEMLETGDRTPPMTNDFQDVATLPMPELSNLDEITRSLSSAKTAQDKHRLAFFIVLHNYIDKLLSVFESCKNKKSRRGPHDPQIPDKKATHRRNLAKLSQMKPVRVVYPSSQIIVPIHNEWVNSKIQQTLRLQYLNDVILCNTIDDSEKSTLRSLINFNNLALVNYFKDEENQEYLHELFYIFRDEKSSDEMKKEASKFVIQLWIMAKEDQTAARAALARTLAKHGIFDMFPFALCADDELLRTHAANVLDSIVELDVCLLRKYTIEQTRTKNAEDTTLGTVLKRFALDNTDPGLKIQYAEIIKASMNLGNGKLVMLRKQDLDTEMYLTVFYESYCNLLLRPFEQVDVKPIKLDGPIEELKLTTDQSDICLYLCDLICLAIRQHSFRSKILMRSTDCFVKIAQLYRCKQSHLKLAALRVFRTCIGLSDKSYTRLLIKFNVFEPTIRVLLDTDGRYNALNSACLEMLEYIRRKNIKLLVEHLIANYGSVLDTISYVTTCEMLRLRHEQNIEPNDSNEAGDEAARDNLLRGNGQDASAIDDAAAEEEYFNNQSSDEEEDQPNKALAESASPNATSSIEPSRGGPLVNYNDSDSSDEEMDNNEEEQQTIAVSSSSSPPSSGDKRRRSFSPDHNKDSNSNNIDTNNNESTLTTAEIEESAVSKSKSPSPSPPTALGTTATTEEQQAEPLGTTATTEEQQAERALSPPPLPKRRMDDEDDEDDVLAARAGGENKRRKRTPSPLASSKASPKKIIIKPQIRKLRSNSK
ncbi:component of IIS longevity pathway SMK-1-domain-containing protein [Zychaea mexicana]|uniref:component of IIS longevity pathway SMK-1-domain-containing protein n=1 Tax=Zychaea mexicana TaxID=64656 RepID=UPI0022FED2C7|nr:component of IIS longevity pathway SMK-1-domain-containing protein [Zychaea mexicana]KAI9474821.1 component of IIS longevity pathway SMK-1-domain-containing protein [Zychaea mexicana]